jgi:hypothetical protein
VPLVLSFLIYLACFTFVISSISLNCASASIYLGVLLLCVGTSLTHLETLVKSHTKLIRFMLELLEGFSFTVGFLCGKPV